MTPEQINAVRRLATENISDVHKKFSSKSENTGLNLLTELLEKAYNLGLQVALDSEANARLMTTDPELLDALESVWIWMDSQSDAQSKGGHATFDLMELRKQRDIASAAIAKATGGAA